MSKLRKQKQPIADLRSQNTSEMAISHVNADKLSCSEMIDLLRGLNLIVSMADITTQGKGRPPRPKFFKQRTEAALKIVKPRLLPQYKYSSSDNLIRSPIAETNKKDSSELRSSPSMH